MPIVPVNEELQLMAEGFTLKRYHNESSALILQGSGELLQATGRPAREVALDDRGRGGLHFWSALATLIDMSGLGSG